MKQKNEDRALVLSVTLKDCDVSHFRSGGPGGQHQNKTDSGTRIVHRASGAVGESREHRSQLQNKKAAFRRMTETWDFKRWLTIQLLTETPEETVAKQLAPHNIKTEVQVDGRWEEL